MTAAEILASPIQIRNINGLNPVTASVNTTPYGSVDGESYSGSNLGKRNILLTLGLNPNWVDQTMESLRHQLYKYFMTKQKVRLTFFSDVLPTTSIVGYVESCEPNIFSRDPEMQVSIICPEPDFVSVTPKVVTGVLLDVDEGGATTTIVYEGTVPTGFVVKVENPPGASIATGRIEIDIAYPTPTIFVLNPATVDDNHYVEISSVRGNKYARNVTISPFAIANVLKNVTQASKWPVLEPGENNVIVMAQEPGELWTLTYSERFGGL